MIETHSQTWRTVEENCRALIEVLRDDIERKGLRDTDSEFIRGQIYALREVLAMPAVIPAPEATEPPEPAPYFY